MFSPPPLQSCVRDEARLFEFLGVVGWARVVLVAAPVLLAGACHGGGGVSGTGGQLCAASGGDLPAGSAPLRRLTRFEYGRTLHDLTGADPAVATALPPDEETLGFDDIADAYSVSALHAQSYLDVAEQVANALAADGARRAAIAGCDPVAGDPGCAAAFIAAFGRRAWRRPLDADEQAAMSQLWQETDAPGTGDGLSAVVTALLQAPQFLYRPEASGRPPLPAALDRFPVPTRLSYLVLGT